MPKMRLMRQIDSENGRICLRLEREYWRAVDMLASEDGWSNWRKFFCMQVITREPKDMPVASFVKRAFITYPLKFFDMRRSAP